MAKTTRVIVPINDIDEEAWRLAVAYALKIATDADPPATDIILLTHTKHQLQHTSLAAHLGDGAAKALESGKTLRVNDDKMLRHATLRTLGGFAPNAVIIAFYAEDKMLDAVDSLKGLTGVVVVPDRGDDPIKAWRDTWNPIVHGSAARPAAKLIEDPLVEKALEAITLLSNVSYGVLQTRDKGTANEILRILRAKGHTLDAAKIKAWAVRKKWHPGAADELSKLVAKVAGLKTKPSLTGIHDPHGRYARWKAEAEEGRS